MITEKDEYQIEFEESLLQYDKRSASSILREFISENQEADFIDEMIVSSLINIGEKWEKGDAALSQVYMSSRLCEELYEKLLFEELRPKKASPPIAIVTLEDSHILGKKIVTSVMKANGYSLVDFGFGISAESVIQRVIEDGIKILMISVLMYPSAYKVKRISEGLHKRGCSVKILVGGSPFNMDPELWKTVGADGMGKTPGEGIKILENWLKEYDRSGR